MLKRIPIRRSFGGFYSRRTDVVKSYVGSLFESFGVSEYNNSILRSKIQNGVDYIENQYKEVFDTDDDSFVDYRYRIGEYLYSRVDVNVNLDWLNSIRIYYSFSGGDCTEYTALSDINIYDVVDRINIYSEYRDGSKFDYVSIVMVITKDWSISDAVWDVVHELNHIRFSMYRNSDVRATNKDVEVITNYISSEGIEGNYQVFVLSKESARYTIEHIHTVSELMSYMSIMAYYCNVSESKSHLASFAGEVESSYIRDVKDYTMYRIYYNIHYMCTELIPKIDGSLLSEFDKRYKSMYETAYGEYDNIKSLLHRYSLISKRFLRDADKIYTDKITKMQE